MTSAQPFPPRPVRYSPALTALAAVLAGFGLGTLALGLARPVPEAAVLPPPAASPPGASPTEAAPRDAGPGTRPWPAAFGEPPPPAPPEAEPEEVPPPRDSPPPPEPDPDYRLRGIITDAEGGWVLAEGPMGIELVRLGDRLSGGERVTEITRQGVVLESFGELFLIEFDDHEENGVGVGPRAGSRQRLNEDEAFDDGDHNDRPRVPITDAVPRSTDAPRTP
ncbi:MAG: hypothetical protein JJT95_00105 [Pararhodobacter sp.]|nr:hypothetical protein [Pararhodobacter sp.]